MFINEEIVSNSSIEKSWTGKRKLHHKESFPYENVNNEARVSISTEALSLILCSHHLYYVDPLCND